MFCTKCGNWIDVNDNSDTVVCPICNEVIYIVTKSMKRENDKH